MDWKTIGNYMLLVGLFVATLTMFNQVNGRLDQMQAETNRRFDTLQAENQRRFDILQTENQRRFDTLQTENNRRFDTLQAENQRQHDEMNRRLDQVLEALRVFEGRITRLEERVGIGAE